MVKNPGREPTAQEIAETAESMKVAHKFGPSYHRNKTELHTTPACKSKQCKDCSDISCPNFSSHQECPPKCRRGCKNQLSRTKPELVPFFIADTGDRGKGLFAKTDIPADTRILYYSGEIISQRASKIRWNKYDDKEREQSYYFAAGDFICDPRNHGNAGQYANNSCQPNMVAVQCKIHGKAENYRGIFFDAYRDIEKGEELTIKYDFDYDSSVVRECKCGELNCTKSLNMLPPQPKKRSSKSRSGASEKKKSKKS
ncbi:hypothetical protein B9Z55_024861 [Caenorhabditis nigoni]|uniref:SET domain-containing protein n=1 Tax=Caenorhabditis nigoni TaxID=1611254 RepID=A0A2G5SW97_9PELO|nr:hypothetical protein B9Z55_024861 [Caenorhabditis nigoni]